MSYAFNNNNNNKVSKKAIRETDLIELQTAYARHIPHEK